ncbi:hypothetical protein B5F13_12110 [Drancourtella sp. An177]|nr:hypothetical protein B5F13_12110 [Drancourtella sp. An177]
MKKVKFLKKVAAALLGIMLVSTSVPVYAADTAENTAANETQTGNIISETPEVPEETPEVPEETPEVPEETPEVPEETPEVPEETPEVPEESPETPETPEETPEVPEETETHVEYQVHVQTYGWQDWVQDGVTSGTTEQSKRLEAIRIKLNDTGISGDVEYRTHVQTYGWQNWVKNGAISGTMQESKRLEAIEIRLTGDLEQQYDIYYRAHVQNFGWLDWAKNGQTAGSEQYSYRMEALEICLVEKNQEAPGETTEPCKYPPLLYRTHVQGIGWQPVVKDGDTSGTLGQSRRLEAFSLSLNHQKYEGSVEYRSHVQGIGWQSWVQNGATSGTVGENKRLEAIEIRLTGAMAEYYDIYYRAHVQQFGWLGWAKNGEPAGTQEYSYRMEALEIRLVEKGGAAPGTGGEACKYPPTLYRAHVQKYGWLGWSADGAASGTFGESKRMEALEIRLNRQKYAGDIEYRSHVQGIGWQSWVKNGATSGTTGENKRLEAIEIRLTGEMAKYYDIYYRAHVQQFGWLGWAKNGESAGTSQYGYRMEAFEIRLLPKGSHAPGSTSNAFRKGKAGWYYENGYKFYYVNNVKQTDIRNVIGAQSSYVIKINKAQSCVTVYANDGSNGYIIPVVAFACSPGSGTPTGTFSTSDKYRWHTLYGAKGQWCTRITGHILFHSLPYTDFNNRTMMPNQYNKLGTWASSGCIRLRAGDAKWIYDYCKSGTKVIIYNESSPGPLGKPVYAKIPANQNWDPTDPTI